MDNKTLHLMTRSDQSHHWIRASLTRSPSSVSFALGVTLSVQGAPTMGRTFMRTRRSRIG
jgi:hypothetical protein